MILGLEMQSASVIPLHKWDSCHCSTSSTSSNRFNFGHSRLLALPNNRRTRFRPIRSKNSSQQHHITRPNLDPSIYIDQFRLSSNSDTSGNKNPETQRRRRHQKEPRTEDSVEKIGQLSTNMWWAELKAVLGQRINVEGIVSSVSVIARDKHLALPHVVVPDIRYIDWAELHQRGFKGVVFDKDNTLTAPYSLTLWDSLGSSIAQCKSVFGHDVAVLSNSAGLLEYDRDGLRARSLEAAIDITVLRHRVKKPAGAAEEIEQHFGCNSSQLIMVGDRPFTDIVYGNRNGFLTILTQPLSLAGEPFIVRQVRKAEVTVMNHWFNRGLKAPTHNLLPDPMQCVKDPSSS